MGNTPLMALLCAEEGLLAVGVGVWRIRRDEVRNRSSLQQTQSSTTSASDGNAVYFPFFYLNTQTNTWTESLTSIGTYTHKHTSLTYLFLCRNTNLFLI